MCGPDLLKKLFVVGLDLAALVQQTKNASRVLVDQLNHSHVVREFYLPTILLEAFLNKNLFFLLVDILDVELVQFLVCVVYHDLLKAILIEDFESVNI